MRHFRNVTSCLHTKTENIGLGCKHECTFRISIKSERRRECGARYRDVLAGGGPAALVALILLVLAVLFGRGVRLLLALVLLVARPVALGVSLLPGVLLGSLVLGLGEVELVGRRERHRVRTRLRDEVDHARLVELRAVRAAREAEASVGGLDRLRAGEAEGEDLGLAGFAGHEHGAHDRPVAPAAARAHEGVVGVDHALGLAELALAPGVAREHRLSVRDLARHDGRALFELVLHQRELALPDEDLDRAGVPVERHRRGQKLGAGGADLQRGVVDDRRVDRAGLAVHEGDRLRVHELELQRPLVPGVQDEALTGGEARRALARLVADPLHEGGGFGAGILVTRDLAAAVDGAVRTGEQAGADGGGHQWLLGFVGKT